MNDNRKILSDPSVEINDSISIEIIYIWCNGKYKTNGEKLAALQSLIKKGLDEKERLTRHACSEAVIEFVSNGGSTHKHDFDRVCMEARYREQ